MPHLTPAADQQTPTLRRPRISCLALAVMAATLAGQPALAQQDRMGPDAAVNRSQVERAPARILREVRNDERVRLTGSAHPRARTEDDRGPVQDDLVLERMILVLQSSEAQTQALAALQQAQQDPASPQFHQWLSPQDFADRFGVAAADIAAISGWLTQQGFRVDEVSAGGRSIVFSGTAQRVRAAFGVQLRQYERDGVRHIAHADEVQLPAALAAVVSGVASLHDFRSQPQHSARPFSTP